MNASIQLKNLIIQYWKFKQNEDNSSIIFNEQQPIIIISNDEKEYIRGNILQGELNCITTKNYKILKQLNQCIKKILYFDFEKQWKDIYAKTIIDFLDSNDPNKVYTAILLFYQLSKIYQYESEERKKVYEEFFKIVHPKFITVLSQCSNSNDPIQSQFMYKIFKIYPKSFQQLRFPSFLNNVELFDTFISYVFFVLQTPIDNVDSIDKNSPIWKLKRALYEFLETLANKHIVLKKVGIQTEIEKYLYTKVVEKIINTIKTIYVNVNENKKYIDDSCKYYIYRIMTMIINRRYQEHEIINIFADNENMIIQLIKDSVLLKEEIDLFYNEPKTYIMNNIDIDTSLKTKRSAVFRFVYSLLQYKPKNEKKAIMFHKFYTMFISILSTNEISLKKENDILKTKVITDIKYSELQYNLIKESILFIFQSINSLITKYASSSVEKLIEMFVLPEFESIVGFMRERACTFIEMLKGFEITNEQLLIVVTKQICSILEKETLLPVKVMAALAAPTLLVYKKIKYLLKGNVRILLALYIKLMNEMDLEEIIECLQEIIKYFKDEVRAYVEEICDFLVKYFYSLTQRDNNPDENNNSDFDFLFIFKQIIQTIREIIVLFINDTEIYEKIMKYVNVILLFCFKNNSFSLLENGIEILHVIVSKSQTIPKTIWAYYVKMINTIIDEDSLNVNSAQDALFDFINVGDVSKILCHYIDKDPNTFINEIAIPNTSKTFIEYTFDFINIVITISEKEKGINNIRSILSIIEVILEKYRGKIDPYVNILIKILTSSLTNKDNQCMTSNKYKLLLCDLISYISIYNPLLFSSHDSMLIFSFWLTNVSKANTQRQYQNNLIGLCSLLLIGDQINNDEFMKELVNRIYELAQKAVKKKNKKKAEIIEEDEDEFEDLNAKVDQLEDFYNEIHDKEIDEEEELENEDAFSDDEFEGVITQLSKQNKILYLRDAFNSISTMKPAFMMKIQKLNGDQVISGINSIILSELKAIK